MAAVNKPVKFLTDLVTKKEIVKKDGSQTLFNVSGTVAGGGHVSSSLPLTASSIYTPELYLSASTQFDGINGVVYDANNRYNVDQALHQINSALKSGGYSNIVRIEEGLNAYKRLRFQATGTFNPEGYAEVMLPVTMSQYDAYSFDEAKSKIFTGSRTDLAAELALADTTGQDPNFLSFPTMSFDYINLDVMVRDCEHDPLNPTGPSDPSKVWTNDILAINLIVSGAANDELWVRMWAPELAGSDGSIKYRLLAVNEDPARYIIR